jgi:hypothetical protein
MEPSDLLRHVVAILEILGIPYLVTGAVAAIAYGEPRFTNDIDLVVDLAASKISELRTHFPSPEYTVSEAAIREAVARKHQFNIIHPGLGLKIDMIVRKDTPFDRGRFVRRRRLPIAPEAEASFASPEDVILKKLEYYREGGSEKHLRDIAGILKITGDRVELDYISKWSEVLGVTEIWEAVSKRRG